jgi:outer membrane protein assembly factor BamE (lipoprotein component of BamABCDE complex)
MRRLIPCLSVIAVLLSGCYTPSKDLKMLSLGMSPEQVREIMGEPYTIRAAKIYDSGKTTEVWEYISKFTFNPSDYWVFFENGKVVQWGEPGDFTGTQKTAVPEYTPERDAR